jgi:transcriptional regulator with XRE-family HTH domain
MMCDMSQVHATLSGGADEMISAAVWALKGQRRMASARVAQAAGVSKAALYRKLSNESPWTADEVDRLAQFFRVSRDSLYEGRTEFQSGAPANLDARTRSSTDRASDYGSEGWEFESLRVHPLRRKTDRRRHLSVVPLRLGDDLAATA